MSFLARKNLKLMLNLVYYKKITQEVYKQIVNHLKQFKSDFKIEIQSLLENKRAFNKICINKFPRF